MWADYLLELASLFTQATPSSAWAPHQFFVRTHFCCCHICSDYHPYQNSYHQRNFDEHFKNDFYNFLFTFYSGLFRVHLISSRWYFICGPKLKPCVGFIVIKSIFICKTFQSASTKEIQWYFKWNQLFEVVTFVFCAPCLSWNLFWFHFKIAFCLPFFLLRPTHCSIAKVIFNLCARLSKQAPLWSWVIPQGNFGTLFFSTINNETRVKIFLH